MTHADFKPVNLLRNKEGKVIVLDWEFAHAGIGILDFSILLRHCSQFPCDLNELSQSYQASGGVLPSEWVRSALITDFVNIATLIEVPPERPQLFEQLKRAVRITMNHWESKTLASEIVSV